jgi:CRP-like cAMP-binding protein
MPVSELALRACSLFAQAPDALIGKASNDMEIVHLKRREVLLQGGKPFRGLGVVLQGRMQAIDQTLDGREVALQTIEVQEAFGQVNLLARRPITLNWVAVAPTSLAIMNAAKALLLFETGSMSLLAARDMADQVNEYLSWQKILTVTPISSRVCAWVCWAALGQARLDIPKHAELAWRLNTTRESITRTFHRLQADGLLRRDDDAWLILDSAALGELALGDRKGIE